MKFSFNRKWVLFFFFVLISFLISQPDFEQAPASAQNDGWNIGDIVGLPKGKLIRQGPGFDFPAHTCVPEDNWLVEVIGGPRFADGETWYDISRQIDGLPTSGTGWVAFGSADIEDECPIPGGGGDGDLLPPEISNVEPWQDGEGNVIIYATVTDNVAVASVLIEVPNGSQTPMIDAGNDRYYAIFSDLQNGTTFEFAIQAMDTSGNVSYYPHTGFASVDIHLTGQAGLLPWTVKVMEPVTLPLGNFVTQHSDLMLESVGMPFDFQRTYNAHTPFHGPLGYGWTHNYRYSLEKVDNHLFSGVKITYPDGHTAKFAWDGTSYVSPDGHYDTLVKIGQNFVLITPDQTNYLFSTQNQLWRIQDRNDNYIEFTYNGDNLTQIQDTAGRIYTLTYNGNHISTLTDPIGRIVVYNYDSNSDLIEVILPNNRSLKYAYDNEHRLESIEDPNGQVFVSNVYDEQDRVIEQYDAKNSVATFDYSDEDCIVLIDNESIPTTYCFNDKYLVVEEIDALGYSILFEYNTDNNPTLITDKSGNSTQYQYDEYGNITQVIDALGNMSLFNYENGHELTYFQDRNGNVVTATYDASGNLTSITTELGTTTYHYDSQGQVIEVNDPAGNITRYEYDVYGNLSDIFDAENNHTHFDFDIASRITRVVDANNHETQYIYNDADYLVEVVDPAGNSTFMAYSPVGTLSSVQDRNGFYTYFYYDENDQVIEIVDEEGFSTQFSYDRMYNIKTVTDRRGASVQFGYDVVYNTISVQDRSGAITTYKYNPNGEIVASIDALGYRTEFERNAIQQVIQITDPLSNITRIQYDAIGQPVEVVDARNATAEYEYNAIGQLTLIRNALGFETVFEYDSRGNLIRAVDARNNKTLYEYDAINQLISITDALGQNQYIDYDPVGNIIEITDKRGAITTFEYSVNDNLVTVIDAEDGVTRYEHDPESQITAITNPNNHTTNYEYSPRGDVTAVELPGGQRTTLEYDPNRNLASITNAKDNRFDFSYDPRDLLEQIRNPLGHSTIYNYNQLGQLDFMVDAENHKTVYEYDPLGRLTAVVQNYVNGSFNNPTLSDQDVRTVYEYDPMGALLSITDPRGNIQTFDVDILGQITQETDALGNFWLYDYDEVGNVVESQDGNGDITQYIFDSLNRLVDIVYDDGTNTHFILDPNNNMVEMTDESGTTRMGYDALNRLTYVTKLSQNLSAQTINRRYDPASNLVAIEYPNGNLLEFSYNVNEWLAQTNDPLNGVTAYDLDADGLLLATHHPNGVTESRVYDVADQLTRVSTQGPNGIYAQFDYDYDNVGNRIRAEQTFIGPQPPTPNPEGNRGTPTPIPTISPTGTPTPEFSPTNTATPISIGGTPIPTSTENPTATPTVTPTPTATSTTTPTSTPSRCPLEIIAPPESSPPSISDLIAALDAAYEECDAIHSQGVYNGLRQTLVNAQQSLDNGQIQTAVSQIEAFINTLEAQSGNQVDADVADYLIDLANQVIAGLLGQTAYIPSNAFGRPANQQRPLVHRVAEYQYDSLHRLTSAWYDYGNPSTRDIFTYQYDLVGNILTETTNWNTGPGNQSHVYSRFFEYNQGNQLVKITEPNGTINFSYDNNGNRTVLNGYDRIVEYEYDMENRLNHAVLYSVHPGQIVFDEEHDFSYDGLSRRFEHGVRDQGGRKYSQYLYADFSFEPIVQMDNPNQTHYYYRDTMGQRLSMHEIQGQGRGLQYFFHYDGVGNTSAVTNQSGREVYVYDYAPFGTLSDVNQAQNASNRTDPHNHMTFNDVEWQEGLQLYNFGARLYDPTSLNWISQDVYRGTLTDSVSLHRYSFVRDNPATFADFGGFFNIETGTVEAGDSLWSIAQQVYGDGTLWPSIYAENSGVITDPDIIVPGQILNINANVEQASLYNPQDKSDNGGTHSTLEIDNSVSDVQQPKIETTPQETEACRWVSGDNRTAYTDLVFDVWYGHAVLWLYAGETQPTVKAVYFKVEDNFGLVPYGQEPTYSWVHIPPSRDTMAYNEDQAQHQDGEWWGYNLDTTTSVTAPYNSWDDDWRWGAYICN